MNRNPGWIAAGLVLFLGGCAAPQGYMALKEGSLGKAAGRIGIAMSPAVKPDTYFPGAACLLCIATANLANRALTQHAQSLSTDELSGLPQEVASALKSQGVDAVVIAEPLDINALPEAKRSGANMAKKDFSAWAVQHGIDRLLMIQLGAVGYTRSYASYVPTSDPKALSSGASYIVDLKTNGYDWYLPYEILKSASGNWDEPPGFPGLTNAYFQALEGTREAIVTEFVKAR